MTHSKAARGTKGILVLLAVLILTMLLLIPSVSAASVYQGLSDARVDAGGNVTVTFPPQGEPLYLIVYEESSPGVFAEKSAAPVENPSSGRQPYAAMDPAKTSGGTSLALYFAVISEGDYDAYRDETVTKEIQAEGNALVISWTNGGAEESFRLTKETVTRPVDVRNVTALNTSEDAVNPYAVKANDAVTVTVQANTPSAAISDLTFEGKTFSFTRSSDPVDGVYYTYTSIVTVPGGLAPNEARQVAFSFIINNIMINQDSELVNAGAPDGTVLTQYARFNANGLKATVTPPSREPAGLVTVDDKLTISIGGIPRSRQYTVNSLEIGEKTVLPAPQVDKNGRFIYTLDGTERFSSGETLTMELSIRDEVGTVYQITDDNAGLLTYVVRPPDDERVDQLNIKFFGACDNTDSSPATWGVSIHSRMEFSFYTNEIFQHKYEVRLSARDGGKDTYEVVELYLDRGKPNGQTRGYHYTGSVLIDDDFADAIGIRNLGEIDISMTCDSAKFDSFTKDPDDAAIIYYSDFGLSRLAVEYPDGKGGQIWEPGADGNAYIIDKDFIKVTMVFSHSLLPRETALTIANVDCTLSDKTTVEGYVSKPTDFTPDMEPEYYIRKTNLFNDTIVLVYRVPDISCEGYDAFRRSFQSEGEPTEEYLDLDNVPFRIMINTRRALFPGQQLRTIDTSAYGPQHNTGTRSYHKMIYWAPLKIWNPEITPLHLGPDEQLPLDNLDEETYVVVRDGQDISVTFSTGHPIAVDEITTKLSASGTSSSPAPEVNFTYDESKEGESPLPFVYTATFNMGDAPLAGLDDQTILSFIWDAVDVRGQPSDRTVQYSQAPRWAIYYKPLEITEVTVTTSNQKDKTQFCKDEDTVTVTFKANHFVMLDGQTIAAHPGEYTESRRRHREAAEYRFTYEIQNGDLTDLALLPFSFRVEDLAGSAFDCSDTSSGVINRIKYYAPMEVSAEIKSDNIRPEYAKNGDTVTISTVTNHEAQTRDFRIGSREIGDNESQRKNPAVSYRIPYNEAELYEGDIFFSLRVEDPAGNYSSVLATVGEGAMKGTVAATGKVTYDRTAPQVRIMPGFNGFTNEDVTLSFLYSDLYLDLDTLSCVLNGVERISPRGGTDTSYTHEIEMTAEGEYIAHALVKDMAGNEMQFAAVCNLIIDKTKPVIKVRLDRNTFKAGFTLDTITGIEEENLDTTVCTITDGGNVYDWALDMPIEEEGKKTVQTLLRDMAGNTSVPMIYDIFIDATAPQPQIMNTESGEAFQTGSKNFFVGSSAGMSMSLAPIFMGDEAPDKFTVLQVLDENGAVVQDLLAAPNASETYSYGLPGFGSYTLLVEAADGVGNETGPLVYMIEFREQYIFERLVENTPLEQMPFTPYMNDTLFISVCALLLLLIAGIVVLVIWKRRQKKAYMAQEYIIVDDDDE